MREAKNWRWYSFAFDFIRERLVHMIESWPLNLQQYSRLDVDEKQSFCASMCACVKICAEYLRTNFNTPTALDILTSILSVQAGNPRDLAFVLGEFADSHVFFHLANTLGRVPRTSLQITDSQMMVIVHAAHDIVSCHSPTLHLFDCVKFIADSFMSRIYGLSDEQLALSTAGRSWNKIYHMIFMINKYHMIYF